MRHQSDAECEGHFGVTEVTKKKIQRALPERGPLRSGYLPLPPPPPLPLHLPLLHQISLTFPTTTPPLPARNVTDNHSSSFPSPAPSRARLAPSSHQRAFRTSLRHSLICNYQAVNTLIPGPTGCDGCKMVATLLFQHCTLVGFHLFSGCFWSQRRCNERLGAELDRRCRHQVMGRASNDMTATWTRVPRARAVTFTLQTPHCPQFQERPTDIQPMCPSAVSPKKRPQAHVTVRTNARTCLSMLVQIYLRLQSLACTYVLMCVRDWPCPCACARTRAWTHELGRARVNHGYV